MLGRNFHYHAVVHQAHAHGRAYAAYVCIAHSSDFISLFIVRPSFAFVSFFRFYFVSYACPFGALLRFNALAFNYWHFYIGFVSVCAIARISDLYYLNRWTFDIFDSRGNSTSLPISWVICCYLLFRARLFSSPANILIMKHLKWSSWISMAESSQNVKQHANDKRAHLVFDFIDSFLIAPIDNLLLYSRTEKSEREKNIAKSAKLKINM